MINPVNNFAKINNYYSYKTTRKTDNISEPIKPQEQSPIKVSSQGKVSRISFRGQLKNPEIPAIQMKVRGVSHHQKNYGSEYTSAPDRNVENLANSNWVDGKKLSYKLNANDILIIDPDNGELGRVPDEITPSLYKLLSKCGDEFQFELANVIAGTTKSAPTIGLRVNLKYVGKNEKNREKANRTFDYLLNSEDKDIKDKVMIYQPKTSPEEVLERIFDVTNEKNGAKAVQDLKETVQSIADEINNPNNKNILLLGHCLPDGDTIGCVLGLQAAIKAKYPDKRVQCSVDDRLPGLYRDKLPGAEKIARPYNHNTIKELEENITKLESSEQTKQVKEQIDIYKKELDYLKRRDTYFDAQVIDGKPPEKYDLVVLMDIPSPSRFTTAYKDYIENAGKVIYIDHHPYHYEEWNNSRFETGIDMKKIKSQNLALIAPSVPAATQLVTIVANEAGLLDNTMQNVEAAKQFVASIVSGTSSDTGCFLRSANYTPEDVQKPVKERPNLLPEGLSRWLIDSIGRKIDKKWIREHIVYDLSDKESVVKSLSPRQQMIDYSIKSQDVFAKTGFASISISYDQMFDVWENSREFDDKVSFIDVQNSFKYSDVMGALREPPGLHPDSSVVPYSSPYQDDKISLLLIQDKEKGKIDQNSRVADMNGIRMSFRSQDGTNYAELLASLFNGGGHGSASGARIDLDGVKVDSKIAIKIDGKVEYNPKKIYMALLKNDKLKKNSKLDDSQKIKCMHKFETILDENGITIPKLINSVVKEIRSNPH